MHDMTKMRYRPNGGQLFMYPLMAVWAGSKLEADNIAQPTENDGLAKAFLALDSAEAQMRLGVFGEPGLRAKMERGD
jgi:hypothetical protein